MTDREGVQFRTGRSATGELVLTAELHVSSAVMRAVLGDQAFQRRLWDEVNADFLARVDRAMAAGMVQDHTKGGTMRGLRTLRVSAVLLERILSHGWEACEAAEPVPQDIRVDDVRMDRSRSGSILVLTVSSESWPVGPVQDWPLCFKRKAAPLC